MKPGVEILRELAFKKPEAMAMGYIIYAVHNNPEHLKNLRSYDIVGCSWEEALEKRKAYKSFVNKNSKVVMLKVIMEVVEPVESGIIKSEKELYLQGLKITKDQKRVLEDFFVIAQQLKIERETSNEVMPFAPTEYLKQLYEQIIKFNAGHLPAVQRLEEIFTF